MFVAYNNLKALKKSWQSRKTLLLTYFVLCKELYGVVGPRLQLAQVEVGRGEGDHPSGVTRALDHGRHILILVLIKTTGFYFSFRIVMISVGPIYSNYLTIVRTK